MVRICREASIDDIQFSTQAVPEQGTIALFALGAIAMMGQFARRKGLCKQFWHNSGFGRKKLCRILSLVGIKWVR